MRRHRPGGPFASAVAAIMLLATGAPEEASDLTRHQDSPGPADLIFTNGRIWTGESDPPPEAIAIRGDTIAAVGSAIEVLALQGSGTQVIDLGQRMLVPGFNDAHTHFQNAAEWFFRVSLYEATSAAEVLDALAAAVRRVPPGFWITGGDFGAATAWAAQERGAPLFERFHLDQAALDAITPLNPVLLRRHDGAAFANSLALARARWDQFTPDPRGGRIERDPQTGHPTGLLYGRAAERMAELMPPPSLEQTLVGARAALEDLRRAGITSIQDVARMPELSERRVFHTHVERSSTNLEIFRELQRRNELTVRVDALLTLPLWREIREAGVIPGIRDGMIRFGTLKGFIDATLMEASAADRPGHVGSFTFRFVDEETMLGEILGADTAGFDIAVHVTGDKAHRLLLDWYSSAFEANPDRDRRFRLVHAWYPTPHDIQRAGRLGLTADVTPYHLIRSLPSLERTLGSERAGRAHPWRDLIEAGVRINLVSDWPGSYNEQQRIPLSPVENIGYAVTRMDRAGRSHRPDQALTLEEALRAYTVHPAWASRADSRKGTIAAGKWADLAVLSQDLFALPPDQISAVEVEMTVLGGTIVYRKGKTPANGQEAVR